MKHNKTLGKSCSDIVQEMHISETAIVPMRIAFYKSWNEIIGLSYPSIISQVTHLRKSGREGKILVIPIANFFDDFDTQTILPSIISKLVSFSFLCKD